MKLLLKVAFFTKRHCILFLFSFITLFGLTISNQLEMFALGIISDTGADFFTLFASKNAKGISNDSITLQEVEKKWDQIDQGKHGKITKKDVQHFMAKKRDTNLLKRVMYQIKDMFHLEQNLKALIVLLLCMTLNKAFFLFFSRYVTQKLSICICHDLRQRYFHHLQQQSMSFFKKYNVGTLSSRILNDVHQIANSINFCIINYFQTPFTLLSTFLFCVYMSWKLSLMVFLGLPLICIPVMLIARKVKRIAFQLQRNQEDFFSVFIDFLTGIQTIKIFAMETFSYKKYKKQNDKIAKLETKTAKYDFLIRPILHTVVTLCFVFIIVIGLYMLEMRLSELLVFIGLLHLCYDPMKKFLEGVSEIQKGVVAVERMHEVINLKTQIVDHPLAIHLRKFKHSIEFKNVWFRYEDQWVLQDLSFTINKGETVAFVGKTGVGKSTIVQLIPRLYDIQKGKVLIDGRAVQEYTQKSLREQIGFVAQKPFLFYDTIAANIAYGKPFSRDAIMQAAKKAYAHEFIEHLPEKYDTILAEMGKNFSGGQQQRIAIARALVKNAPILILDEATSSLDAISEHNIKMAIKALYGEVTQILIAHRLSTIAYADRIIYLEKGIKVAEGTREELLATCPSFRLLWDTHFCVQKEEDTFVSAHK